VDVFRVLRLLNEDIDSFL